jgi:hypothetical protein
MLMTHFGSWNTIFMGEGFLVDTQQSGPQFHGLKEGLPRATTPGAIEHLVVPMLVQASDFSFANMRHSFGFSIWAFKDR